MTGTIEKRLAELGITLPEPTTPQGSYTPFVRSGNLVFISGQGPRLNGRMVNPGAVGAELSVTQGQEAARACGLNLIAQMREACGGDLDRVRRVVRLGGVVRCTADCVQQATVLNGASDLMRDVFGEKGVHARLATGAIALPSGMAVEVEAVVEVD